MDQLGYGKGYKYAHDYEGHWVEQEFMPAGLEGRKFYEPQHKREHDAMAWKEALKQK
jgi:putative ATPase